MRWRPLLLVVLLLGCSDRDDTDIRGDVTLLMNHEGAVAAAAADHLAAYGKRAIPTIEGAMHTASVPGKKNLVMALRRIGDADAVPLLRHIATFDPASDVRREAEWTLKKWAADVSHRARADAARAAVRAVEEARSAEQAG